MMVDIRLGLVANGNLTGPMMESNYSGVVVSLRSIRIDCVYWAN